jgi:thioredoxin reductase
MAVDTPARIVILGGGPIGIEAALYGRFLGYEVEIYEEGAIAENVRRWGHVRMFTPFRLLRSTLGLAAIQAQEPDYRAPDDDTLLTGQQWV